MPIDSSIYSNIGRGVKSVADYETEAATTRQNKLAEIMNSMKMDEYQRGIKDQNQLRDVYSQFGTDSAANTNALYKAGLGKQAGDYAKAAGDLAKDKSAAEKTQAETLDKSLGTFRSYVAQVTTPEAAGQYTAAMYDHPLLGKFAANFGSREDAIKRNMDAFSKDPRAWTTGAAGMTADKLLETMKGTRQNTNVGGSSQGQTIDYYGQVVPGQTTNTPITQSADSVASNVTARANNAATVGATYAGQKLTDQRARDANKIADQGNVVKTETDLRKEFADLPEVKRYKAAFPSFKAIENAAKVKNPQADINLIYGLAKLYDPESVVREGEYATIANSQAVPEKIKSIAQSLTGGGKLTDETKRQIIEQARGRIATFEGEYSKAKDAYGGIATGRGARVENVIPKVGEPVATPAQSAPAMPAGFKVIR